MSRQQVAKRIVERETPAAGEDGILAENIGIDIGGLLTPVLGVGMATPCESAQVLSTSEDDQRELWLELYRGNRMMAKDCTFLGRFGITGLDARPAGIPQVAVTFSIRDGDLLIEAQDVEGRLTLQIEEHPIEKRGRQL